MSNTETCWNPYTLLKDTRKHTQPTIGILAAEDTILAEYVCRVQFILAGFKL
jgi:hypothetical protein